MVEIKKAALDKAGKEVLPGNKVKFLDGDTYTAGSMNGDSLVCYSIPERMLFIFKPNTLLLL